MGVWGAFPSYDDDELPVTDLVKPHCAPSPHWDRWRKRGQNIGKNKVFNRAKKTFFYSVPVKDSCPSMVIHRKPFSTTGLFD
jgi:hypothetical protein